MSTRRAAFGSALTARELRFGGICVRPLFLSNLAYGDGVSGRTYAGASCPIVSVAREASTLSLATYHGWFSRHGIDPVGETPNVPDTPLGSRRLVVSPPALANRRHQWYFQTKSRKRQEGPRSQPSPRSRGRGRVLSPSPLRRRVSASLTQSAAGIDVHSDMHMVCVPVDRDVDPVRQFGANTADLHEIVAWLKKCRVKTVAMESTGVYWIPLFELLESEGFAVYLVEPGQLSRCGAPQDGCARLRSGSSGCIPTVCCVPRFGLRISFWRCVPTGGSGRCSCATPPVMSSTCRRPWSR